jgi:hypothetical protein
VSQENGGARNRRGSGASRNLRLRTREDNKKCGNRPLQKCAVKKLKKWLLSISKVEPVLCYTYVFIKVSYWPRYMAWGQMAGKSQGRAVKQTSEKYIATNCHLSHEHPFARGRKTVGGRPATRDSFYLGVYSQTEQNH